MPLLTPATTPKTPEELVSSCGDTQLARGSTGQSVRFSEGRCAEATDAALLQGEHSEAASCPRPPPALHDESEPPGPWEARLDEFQKPRVLNLRPYVVCQAAMISPQDEQLKKCYRYSHQSYINAQFKGQIAVCDSLQKAVLFEYHLFPDPQR